MQLNAGRKRHLYVGIRSKPRAESEMHVTKHVTTLCVSSHPLPSRRVSVTAEIVATVGMDRIDVHVENGNARLRPAINSLRTI